MISPFEVYLIFQLDAIRGAAEGVLLISAIISAALIFVGCMAASEGVLSWKLYAYIVAITGSITFGSLLTVALVPSSKSAAAIILIPAIANNESVQAEASELYTLAKEGLRTLVSDEKKSAE